MYTLWKLLVVVIMASVEVAVVTDAGLSGKGGFKAEAFTYAT